MRILPFLLTLLFFLISCDSKPQRSTSSKPVNNQTAQLPIPKIIFTPKQYVCYRTNKGINIDGEIIETDWQSVRWTDHFVDIEGVSMPLPHFNTRVKMLWDDQYLYFAGDLEEPDIWATLKKRDSIIYHDNDFEVFIDPDGDTHQYYELEVNAYGTIWDLFLVKPYRDGGPAIHSWDIRGLKCAVYVDGTINNPGDRDRGWTVEIAIPWNVLKEATKTDVPPKPGDQWRINFSRVEWNTEVENNSYKKKIDPQTNKPYPESNWVWSAQGLINMHYPEMWGFVQFSNLASGEGKEAFQYNVDEEVKWLLRQLYYSQKNYYRENAVYSDNFAELNMEKTKLEGYVWPPDIELTQDFFQASLQSKDEKNTWFIDHEGKTWKRGIQK